MAKTAEKKVKLAVVAETPLLKLDFGCGKNPREGFQGVDQYDFGQAFKVNLSEFDPVAKRLKPWPWADSSVEVAHSSHFIEHLQAHQRIHFVNELHRVLVPGGNCTMITPHWASCRAYGDLTHQWPPVSEFWFYYLSKQWRDSNAPHCDIDVLQNGYTCDFDCTWGYSLRQELAVRNQEYQQFALQNHKEAAQDIIATLTKKRAA